MMRGDDHPKRLLNDVEKALKSKVGVRHCVHSTAFTSVGTRHRLNINKTFTR